MRRSRDPRFEFGVFGKSRWSIVGLPTARWKEQRVCAKTALATNGKRDISIVSESEDDSEKYKDHTID